MKRKSPCSVVPPEIRFAKKVYKTSSCWVWTGARNRKGYGVFSLWPNGNRTAHRYSWELANGPIPNGMFVCHKCDTPHCVNPDHLFLGTPRDNTHDMIAKGRHSRGEEHGESVRNAKKGNRKLTEYTVLKIKEKIQGGYTQRSIARIYGISQATVGQISRGVTWRTVNG